MYYKWGCYSPPRECFFWGKKQKKHRRKNAEKILANVGNVKEILRAKLFSFLKWVFLAYCFVWGESDIDMFGAFVGRFE